MTSYENPRYSAYILHSVVCHHIITTNNSHRHQQFPPLRRRNPPDQPISKCRSIHSSGKTPLVASAATQDGPISNCDNSCRCVPRATAKILQADRTLAFLVNPLSSCIESHIYPRVAVPSGIASSFTVHFLLRPTSPPPYLQLVYLCLSKCKGGR